jgi:hypothetical protein
MSDYRQQLAKVLTPPAPPRVIDGVYSEDQFERLLDVVKRRGPWPTIQAHHFQSVEELIATTSGVAPRDHGLTLDAIATAQFRGFYAQNSVVYHPEIEDAFYNSRFLALAKDYASARYARPVMMLFNICGPHECGRNAHLDSPTFRGVRYDDTPIWLLSVMAKSGLFLRHMIRKVQIVTWWYRGAAGSFTYWPDGPLEPPRRVDSPMWNRGVVTENELMFHRGDSVGRPEQRPLQGLAHRSLFEYRPGEDAWLITTDGRAIRRYAPEEIRFLVHWSADVYADLDEVKRVMDHGDDLTHARVIDTLLADLRARGLRVAEPADPLHDADFIGTLMRTYTIAPETDWLPPAR